jgi:hypothetical protein
MPQILGAHAIGRQLDDDGSVEMTGRDLREARRQVPELWHR